MFRTIRRAALIAVAALTAACSAIGITEPDPRTPDPGLVSECEPTDERFDCRMRARDS